MSGRRHAVALLVLLAGAVACGGAADQPAETGSSVDSAAAVPAWVGEVAGMANAIEARPAAADSIIAAHDMTRVAFDSLLYEVAADPTLTAAYREARQ
jgi:hypothetical protein